MEINSGNAGRTDQVDKSLGDVKRSAARLRHPEYQSVLSLGALKAYFWTNRTSPESGDRIRTCGFLVKGIDKMRHIEQPIPPFFSAEGKKLSIPLHMRFERFHRAFIRNQGIAIAARAVARFPRLATMGPLDVPHRNGPPNLCARAPLQTQRMPVVFIGRVELVASIPR